MTLPAAPQQSGSRHSLFISTYSPTAKLRRSLNQFFDRPNVVGQPAGHRWRLALQRLMLTAEIIPRHEHRLHGRVLAQALAVAVGQPGEPASVMRSVRLNRSIWLVLILSSSGEPNIGSFSVLIIWPGSSGSSLGCWSRSLSVERSQLAPKRERHVVAIEAAGRRWSVGTDLVPTAAFSFSRNDQQVSASRWPTCEPRSASFRVRLPTKSSYRQTPGDLPRRTRVFSFMPTNDQISST